MRDQTISSGSSGTAEKIAKGQPPWEQTAPPHRVPIAIVGMQLVVIPKKLGIAKIWGTRNVVASKKLAAKNMF